MPYFSVCENCDAHLDPGEECECMRKPAQGTSPGGGVVSWNNNLTDIYNMHLHYTKKAPKCQGGNEDKD